MAKTLGRSRSLRFRNPQAQKETVSTPVIEIHSANLEHEPADVRGHSSSDLINSKPGQRSPSAGRLAGQNGTSNHRQLARDYAAVNASKQHNFSFPHSTTARPTYVTGKAAQDAAIGLALGSPSQTFPFAEQRGQPEAFPPLSSVVTSITSLSSSDSTVINSAPLKSKPKMWKSIGTIFGKKAVASPTSAPFYKLQDNSSADVRKPLVTTEITTTYSAAPRSGSPAPACLAVQSSPAPAGPGAEVAKPLRSPAAPVSNLTKSTSKAPANGKLRSKSASKGLPFRSPGKSQMKVSESSSTALDRIDAEDLVLDISIPSIEMERYSVMFGTVLSKNRQSTLLERRRASIKPVITKNTHPDLRRGISKTRRRVTSPNQPTPTFTLFPSPDLYNRLSKRTSRSQLKRPQGGPGGSSPIKSNLTPTHKVSKPLAGSPDWRDESATLTATPSTPSTSHSHGKASSGIFSSLKTESAPHFSNKQAWQMATKSAPSPPSVSFGSKPGTAVSMQKHVAEVSVARTVSMRTVKRRILHNGPPASRPVGIVGV